MVIFCHGELVGINIPYMTYMDVSNEKHIEKSKIHSTHMLHTNGTGIVYICYIYKICMCIHIYNNIYIYDQGWLLAELIVRL